jgi:hypothetical protein
MFKPGDKVVSINEKCDVELYKTFTVLKITTICDSNYILIKPLHNVSFLQRESDFISSKEYRK